MFLTSKRYKEYESVLFYKPFKWLYLTSDKTDKQNTEEDRRRNSCHKTCQPIELIFKKRIVFSTVGAMNVLLISLITLLLSQHLTGQ